MEQLLREICLEGFKSFRDRTTFKFDGPFTAIVGPNGSGKSNVVDAVKWVLGDQSPRSIRAATGLEAIYRPADGNGSDPTGFASVLIRIDNSEPSAPDEPSVFEIERRYYRSGDSVYTLNGKVARLKDVRAIMSRKGFGLGSLSVVSQGDIDGFLSLVPADRRLVFEDLARISDFKANKRKILSQLEDSARNLQRLQDLVGEISIRADQLTIQAEAARRHADLSASAQDFRAQLAAQEYLLARRNVERNENRLGELNEETEVARKSQSDSIERLAASREALEKARKESAATLAACEEGRRELDLARAEERRLTDASGHLANLIHALEGEVEERESRAGKIRSREEELGQTSERANGERDSAHRRKIEYELYLSRRWGYMRSCERDRERLAARVERLTGESSLFARDAEFHRRRAETLKAESDGLKRRADELAKEIADFEEKLADLSRTIDDLGRLKSENEAALGSIRARLTDLRARRSIADDRRAALTAELAALEREHTVLAELEAAREGYGEGVKAILARRTEFAGLRGSLGELVKPERGFELPVEKALGEYLEFLICDSLNNALKIVETARVEQLGSVTCLVVELLPQAPDSAVAEGELLSHCSIDGGLQHVLALLMSGAKQVDRLDSIESADLTRVLVTSDGSVFRPPAYLSGGSAAKAAPGILTRRGRLAQLTELISERNAEASLLADEIRENASEVDRLQTDEKSVQSIFETAKDDLKTGEARHQKTIELRDQSTRERETVGKRARELDIECEGWLESAKLASASIESVRQLKLDAISDLSRLESDLPGIAKEVEDLRVRVQRAIVEEASYKEEAERARAEIGRLEHEIAQVLEEISKKKSGLEEVRKKAQGTSSELKEAAENRESLEARLPELESAEAEASGRIETLESEVLASEQALEAGREEVGRLENAVHSQEIRLAELRGALSGLERDLNAFPEFADRIRSGDMSGKEIPSKKELSERLELVESDLAALGEVNPLAIEEELFAKARLEELTKEREDLHLAEDELRNALEEIERQSEKAFRSTFDDAAVRFAEVFSALFPGGSGELKLTDPSDPLDSGIDVKVKFPDKGELDLLQFSGGERALIALALLFAILKVKPSSFTILDEVEAALDDVNTQRFLDYLGQEFPDRQFIMITHNKITMERANRLYGVTMREAGVSQMVSVDLKKLKDEGIQEVLGHPAS